MKNVIQVSKTLLTFNKRLILSTRTRTYDKKKKTKSNKKPLPPTLWRPKTSFRLAFSDSRRLKWTYLNFREREGREREREGDSKRITHMLVRSSSDPRGSIRLPDRIYSPPRTLHTAARTSDRKCPPDTLNERTL